MEQNISENSVEVKPKCPGCDSEYDPQEDIFCSNCGYEIKILCPKCNLEYEQKHNFCSNCGNKLNLKMNTANVLELMKDNSISFVSGVIFTFTILIGFYFATTMINLGTFTFNPEIKSAIAQAKKLNIDWDMVLKNPDKYIGEPVIFYCTIIGKEGVNNYIILRCISGHKNHVIIVDCSDGLNGKANLNFSYRGGFRKILGKIKEVRKSEIVVEGLYIF